MERERDREREMQEREEQSAEVEQTNLSFLSDRHQESVMTATRIICRLAAKLHNYVACTVQSTSVKALWWIRVV